MEVSMKGLVVESWLLLFYFEWIMRFRDFKELYKSVRECAVRPTAESRMVPQEDLCRAMDYACVVYLKRVFCLQRSAATTLLLRRHGVAAELVIGAKLLPFRSHAWVELNGQVINDRHYMRTIYQVLERC
jgi:hypothetical protein